jgi:hypothetical protein
MRSLCDAKRKGAIFCVGKLLCQQKSLLKQAELNIQWEWTELTALWSGMSQEGSEIAI